MDKQEGIEGIWCDDCVRYHQPRDNAVPCKVCRKNMTWHPHAVCQNCMRQEASNA